MKKNRWSIFIQAAVLPFRCFLCAGPADGLDLCAACRRDLPWNRGGCPRCAARSPRSAVCGRCLVRPPPWSRATAPLRYRFPVDRMVARFKYSGDQVAGRLLAELMADAVSPEAPAAGAGCLVPVPLHRDRFRERGFDQARTLAMSLGRRFSVPVRPDLLERARPTRPQAGLGSAARRRNVRGAFRAGRGRVPERITLVDDVLTTGATTAAAAGALRRAGARNVELWCLARAGDQR